MAYLAHTAGFSFHSYASHLARFFVLFAGAIQRDTSEGGRSNRKLKPLRVLLVDDDEFMLEVVGKLLRHEARSYAVVAAVGDARSAVVKAAEFLPDIVVLDINLPDKNGIESVAELRNASPNSRILLCTAYATDERISEALRSGAHGFVEKTGQWSDLIKAIDHVAAGEHYICPRSTAALAYHAQRDKAPDAASKRLNKLTPREIEVLGLVTRGYASKEIAGSLHLSSGTVDVHRSNLMKKLGIRNLAGLIAFALESRLIS
jgi:DNA-binding NarL/FixJ family response regulator